MSDPLSNSEIQDVLSSIRRLVSEDRRARETMAPVDVVPGTPVVGKLILTEALRVERVEEVSPQVDEAPFAALADEPVVEDVLAAPVAEVRQAPPVRAASVLEDDIASLESTIAELEAAVADIGAEFEPDGSEVPGRTDTPEARALEEAFDQGFAVDTGDPVRVAPADEALDEPVTGSGLRPAAKADKPEGEDSLRAVTRGPDEIAFLRLPGAMRRADWQVISGGEAGPAVGALHGRLHLRPAGETAEPAEAGRDEPAGTASDLASAMTEPPAIVDGAAVAVEEDAVAQTADAEDAPDDWAGSELPEAAHAPADAMGDPAEIAGLGDADDVLADGSEDAVADLAAAGSDAAQEEASDHAEKSYDAAALASDEAEFVASGVADEVKIEGVDRAAAARPAAGFHVSGGVAEDLADEPAAVEIPEDLETTLLSAAGIAGAAATATPEIGPEAEADEVDLFASGDEAVIDMEMLRELIVQVLREELQGPLGERITRNVRKLVRQEIARALEAQKFE